MSFMGIVIYFALLALGITTIVRFWLWIVRSIQYHYWKKLPVLPGSMVVREERGSRRVCDVTLRDSGEHYSYTEKKIEDAYRLRPEAELLWSVNTARGRIKTTADVTNLHEKARSHFRFWLVVTIFNFIISLLYTVSNM